MAINLQKGQRIDLKKSSGATLTNFCVGANWGAIEREKKKFFGGTKKVAEAVDLDASCALFDTNNKLVDLVFFKKLRSDDGSIYHSGDDRTGDIGGDDGLDNEVITVDLTRVNPAIDKIVFFLNSFEGHDFATVPFASLRLYEGTPNRVDNVYATYDVANDPAYRGHVSMVLGKLYKKNGEWKFNAIGDPTRDRDIRETLLSISQRYV